MGGSGSGGEELEEFEAEEEEFVAVEVRAVEEKEGCEFCSGTFFVTRVRDLEEEQPMKKK